MMIWNGAPMSEQSNDDWLAEIDGKFEVEQLSVAVVKISLFPEAELAAGKKSCAPVSVAASY